jgi:hypothetical protein
VLATLAAFAGQAAVIYKWKDSEGVIHFSDQPVAGAEKITTGSDPTVRPASSARPAEDNQTTGATKPEPGLAYTEFSITSPAPDQTFFADDVVNVNLALDPALKPNQAVTWHLNGKQLDDQGPTTTQFSLPHLDRGSYTIAATVTDQETGESRSTDSVGFFVRQPSELAPLHKKP